jgi:hypothetical protein
LFRQEWLNFQPENSLWLFEFSLLGRVANAFAASKT